MAALTLPSDTGEFHVLNGVGQRIMDTRGDVVYIWGSVSIQENVEIGGNINLHGVIEIDGGGVGNSIWAHGNVLIEGTTTINDTLTVNADTDLVGDVDVTGLFKVYSSGSPVLVVDSGGATLTGKLVAGAITIDDGVMSLGTASITFSSGALQLDADVSASGSLSTSSTLTVSGTATFNGAVNVGSASGDIVAFHGAAGTGRQTVNGSRGGNAALADLLSKLDAKGVIINGTSA